MSAASHMIALPESLLSEAAREAGQLGVSTEQWIEAALPEGLRLEKRTADFFSASASGASGRTLAEILSTSGDNPPDPGDEL